MINRHIHPGGLSLAAIDDIIERGTRSDWAGLRDSAKADPSLLPKIRQVCDARVSDPGAQRHYLWNFHATRRIA
jgi:hypothetical protein